MQVLEGKECLASLAFITVSVQKFQNFRIFFRILLFSVGCLFSSLFDAEHTAETRLSEILVV